MKSSGLNKRKGRNKPKDRRVKKIELEESDLEQVIGGVNRGGFLQGGFIFK